MRPAIFPGSWTEDALTTAGIDDDGSTLRGWVKRPSRVWTPDAELLYQPPDAVKSGDFDRIGSIESFEPHPFNDDLAWVEGQIRKADAYRERVLGMVRAGRLRLTAALRAFLGLAADEDVDRSIGLLQRDASKFAAGRPAGTYKSTAEAVEQGRRLARLAGVPVDADTGLPIVGPSQEQRVREIAAAAAKRYAETGDYAAAMTEILSGVHRTREG